ncbi:hypothetical protein L1987_28200 [Smallanthus sonchifolius]|uniref:Uncharacterized protein n=1 Tax=Smallanthus sonchifolius TaxID=185202 RepID=A0ACB9IE14_9ASTR|nr:hypothetical protein L1987_28200 [Smallanthus sonchifolius]
MSSFSPFIVKLYWGGQVSFVNGVIICDESTLTSSFFVRYDSMSYVELVDTIYNHVQLDRNSYSLKLVLYYTFQGVHASSYLSDEEGVSMLYFLAANEVNYFGQIFVSQVPKVTIQHESFMELMRGFCAPQSNDYEVGASTYTNLENPTLDQHIDDEEDLNSLNSESENGDTEDSEVPPSDDDSGDEVILPQSSEEYNSGIYQGFPTGPVEAYDEVAELRTAELPYFDNEDQMDIWNPESNQIRVGMFFHSKKEVVNAVLSWNVACNREVIVTETRKTCWRAKCYTKAPKYNEPLPNTPPCRWAASACLKKNQHMWQLTKWVAAHNCYGTVQRNNNRCLRSKDVAFHISSAVQADISFPVKQVKVLIKDLLHVDITYSKAWLGRRIAIENIFGSWDSNFNELPMYIKALKASNRGTVVEWLHHPHGSSKCATFKYVFWAFKPSIDAFHLCQPFISVDGTHLKGPYRSKLLIAVSKNANNYILPVAYAIVDEETNESWAWFFMMFREHVVNETMGPLCVISDRHAGIVNAMTSLEGWMEPNAYHRFCLRHVRSNLMKRFKSASLKKLCWAIGSTTQARKYMAAVAQMKIINEDAWLYLNNIPKTHWTLRYDRGHRRWGNLTTNISESLNNALRDARLLPIKACIDYTFQKDVSQYVKHTEIAINCQTALPPRMWSVFNNRDRRAQDHRVFKYDHVEETYRVTSRMETNDYGGNDYTVEFKRKKCTCRKWQMERFPCSHAIAVCRHRNGLPNEIVDSRYYTSTYRQQYSGHYHPLPHKDLWRGAGWCIQGDPSKVTTLRGRRRARRMHNEMDVHYPDEPRHYKCGLCKETGHNRKSCPYRNQ